MLVLYYFDISINVNTNLGGGGGVLLVSLDPIPASLNPTPILLLDPNQLAYAHYPQTQYPIFIIGA